MDKESILQKSREENKKGDEYEIQQKNQAEHASLIVISTGFTILFISEVYGLISGRLWIGDKEIDFGGTLFLIMVLSQFVLNLKYYAVDRKKWRIILGVLLILCMGLAIFRILNVGRYLLEFL